MINVSQRELIPIARALTNPELICDVHWKESDYDDDDGNDESLSTMPTNATTTTKAIDVAKKKSRSVGEGVRTPDVSCVFDLAVKAISWVVTTDILPRFYASMNRRQKVSKIQHLAV